MATQSNYAQDRRRDSEGDRHPKLHTGRSQGFPQAGTLRYCTCECGEIATEVVNATEKVRKGWFCEHCKAFIEASTELERKV